MVFLPFLFSEGEKRRERGASAVAFSSFGLVASHPCRLPFALFSSSTRALFPRAERRLTRCCDRHKKRSNDTAESERREGERFRRETERWRWSFARSSLAEKETKKEPKKASHSFVGPFFFFLASAATRSPLTQLSFSYRSTLDFNIDYSKTARKKPNQNQIFSELANLGPVISSEEANNGQLVTGVFPFRTTDDVVEPHPGLRAYPFLGQVRIKKERESEREEARERVKGENFFSNRRVGRRMASLLSLLFQLLSPFFFSAFPASVAKLLRPSRCYVQRATQRCTGIAKQEDAFGKSRCSKGISKGRRERGRRNLRVFFFSTLERDEDASKALVSSRQFFPFVLSCSALPCTLLALQSEKERERESQRDTERERERERERLPNKEKQRKRLNSFFSSSSSLPSLPPK